MLETDAHNYFTEQFEGTLAIVGGSKEIEACQYSLKDEIQRKYEFFEGVNRKRFSSVSASNSNDPFQFNIVSLLNIHQISVIPSKSQALQEAPSWKSESFYETKRRLNEKVFEQNIHSNASRGALSQVRSTGIQLHVFKCILYVTLNLIIIVVTV